MPHSAQPPLDPTLKILLDAVPMRFDPAAGVDAARAMLRRLNVPAEMLPDLRTEDRRVAGDQNSPDRPAVPVRVYWPPDAAGRSPVVVLYHGGGWCIGDLDTHDPVARAHCVGAGAIVVSVDYRLAPEHPFPAGVEDSWAVLRWVGAHAGDLGGDPSRIAVAGDSAGANIAAVMTRRARDGGGPRLAFQLLWYPSTTGDMGLPSMTENADAPVLDREMIDAFLNWYLPGVDLGVDPKTLPPDLAPANADLSGLPPAYIGTAEHDPLRDDGARYAGLLRSAGVPVELRNEPSLVHGFVNLALAVPAAAEATERGLAALRAGLGGDR